MTLTTKKDKKLFLTTVPIIAVLVASISLMPTEVYAVDCISGGNHCYAIARKTISNLGGYAQININSGNSVVSGYGIANPVWVGFGTNE